MPHYIQNDSLHKMICWGGHTNIDSFTGGFHSFLQDIEQLNLLINTYNIHQFVEDKQKIKDNMQFWEPEHQEYNQVVGFLNKIIIKCNDFPLEF